MAIQRIKIDTKGKNILQIFFNNINEIGAINKTSAGYGNANTYDGPDGPVNINWPRKGDWDNGWKYPTKYYKYYVREITAPQMPTGLDAMETAMYQQAGYPLPPDQPLRDESGYKVEHGGIDDSFAGKRHTTLGYTNNAYNNAGAVGWGRGPQGAFMATKGRKSLYTLLQETMGVFFEGRRGPVYHQLGAQPREHITNKDSGPVSSGAPEDNTYDYKYMDNQGRSFVDPPTGLDFTAQALLGFNLGQTLGGNITFEDRIKTEAQNISRGFIEEMADAAGANENEFIANYYQNLLATLYPVERISQLYVPGWGRPAENWLTKKTLSENLNQNLLLPPNSGEVLFMNPTDNFSNTNNNGVGLPGIGDPQKTFQSLYTRNRAGKAGGVAPANSVFNNGKIAGTPINLLQEPGHITTQQIKADPSHPIPQTVNVPFTFEEDDAKYLTYSKKETGFTSNSDRTNVDPSRLQAAVRDYSATQADESSVSRHYHLGDATVKVTQGQYFPFAFSTFNKKRNDQVRIQVCYLQAIINSLGESYTPTWNSRHFFGRSEQAHTYTFTDRTIDISFTIFANEMRQLQNVYERVLWLAQQCYPDYDAGGRMSEGPIIALRVGDLFQYKTGMIRSLSYDWMFGGGKWEMTSGMRMPQGCTVTMSYQVIHDQMPNRNTDFYGGPAGGLNSATERYRTISGGENAFDAFDVTEGSKVGFGERLIDSGTLSQSKDEDLPFLDWVKLANMNPENVEWHADRIKNLRVPVGTDDSEDGIVWAE